MSSAEKIPVNHKVQKNKMSLDGGELRTLEGFGAVVR
jgi:hypothetical protein